VAAAIDRTLRYGLENILGSAIPPECWPQVTLPIRLGGFGIGSAAEVAPIAYLSSLSTAQLLLQTHRPNITLLQELNATKQAVKSLPPFVMDTQLDTEAPLKQKDLMNHSHKFRLESYLQHLTATSPIHAARMRACSQARAGSWLTVFPNRVLGTYLSNHEFSVLLRFRLGMAVYPTSDPLYCRLCHSQCDNMGVHSTQCETGGDRTARHDRLRDTILTLIRSSGLSTSREPPGLLQGLEKPADIFVWRDSTPTALDVTVRSPLQKTLIKQAAEEGLVAARQGENVKNKKYNEAIERAGLKFLPLAFETFGGMSPATERFLVDVGTLRASRLCQELSVSINQVFQQVSITLQRGIALNILKRFPEGDFLPDGVDSEMLE